MQGISSQAYFGYILKSVEMETKAPVLKSEWTTEGDFNPRFECKRSCEGYYEGEPGPECLDSCKNVRRHDIHQVVAVTAPWDGSASSEFTHFTGRPYHMLWHPLPFNLALI